MRVLVDYGGLCEERRLVVDATSSRTAAVNEDDVVSYHWIGY